MPKQTLEIRYFNPTQNELAVNYHSMDIVAYTKTHRSQIWKLVNVELFIKILRFLPMNVDIGNLCRAWTNLDLTDQFFQQRPVTFRLYLNATVRIIPDAAF